MPPSLKDQIKEKDREIALLHAISRIANTAPGSEELLKKLCQLVEEQLTADTVLIYIFNDQREELILRGANRAHADQLGSIRLKLGEGITGWVAEKRKRVAISEHAGDDPRFKFFQNLKEDRFEAFLSVPIILKSELIGVMNVHHKKTHVHSPTELELAETIASEVAGAIDHSNLHHSAQRRSQRIEALARMTQSIAQGSYLREILQLIVTMTAEMVGSKICSLMLLDEKGRHLKIEATQSLSQDYKSKPAVSVAQSVSGRAILEKRPVIVEDVTKDPQFGFPEIARKEGLRSLLVIPMMTKEKVIGVLNCYGTEVRTFPAEDVQLVQVVANQAAIAIEHTRAIERALEAQEALETRKVIERAKGILMRQQGFSEEAAFRLIQRQAMDRRKSMKEIAEAVILSAELQQKKS